MPGLGMNRARAIAGLLLCAATIAGADTKQKPSLRIRRITRPPSIEQFIENIPREAEAVVTGFRQREPADGLPVSRPTTAYLSYDRNTIYVVFVCADDPAKIRARLA